MNIGQRIKNLREKKCMSQTELADKIHTTKQNIYKYETGVVTNIPSDKIELIATALGCSPSYIMGWNDDEHSFLNPTAFNLSGLEAEIIASFRRADRIDREMVLRILKLEEKGDDAAFA